MVPWIVGVILCGGIIGVALLAWLRFWPTGTPALVRARAAEHVPPAKEGPAWVSVFTTVGALLLLYFLGWGLRVLFSR